MNNDFIIQQKVLARKNIAKYYKMLRKLGTSKERLDIIKSIAIEQSILDFKINDNALDTFAKFVYNIRQAEMAIELPGAPAENPSASSVNKVNFGQFLNAIDKDIKEEESKLAAKSIPTQNDLIRWARKWAFQQYYKVINISPDQPITKTFGDDKTLRQLAPNKESIYKLYLDKLEELRRRTDRYRLHDEEFNDTLYDGTPQGGSFEKWLERHREDLMNSIYANI